MGSVSRVTLFQTNLEDYLKICEENNIDRVGTFMEGENIRTFKTEKPFVLIIGNEGSGISQETASRINRKITIPLAPGSDNQARPESLNAAISAGICLYEISAPVPKKAQ